MKSVDDLAKDVRMAVIGLRVADANCYEGRGTHEEIGEAYKEFHAALTKLAEAAITTPTEAKDED